MRQIIPANTGIKLEISLGGENLAGQQSANLSQTVQVVDISNKILCDWTKSISSTKSWSVNCSGLVIKNQESFDILENAFFNGTELDLLMSDNEKTFSGKAIISSFPIDIKYDNALTYKIDFKGNGGLSYND